MPRNITLILTNYFVGIAIRLWLFFIDYNTIFMNRVEISTPLNSWRRVVEANYISKISNSPNPYESDVIYEPPLYHMFYMVLSNLFGEQIYLMFIIADILTSYCLCVAGKKYLETLFKKEISNIDDYLPDAVNFIIKEQEIESVDVYIVAAYMLNPYIIFNCVGYTTTVFQNLYLGLFFVGIVKKNVFLASISLAAAISQSFYPILLLAPLFVTFNDKRFNATLVTTLTLIISGLILIISSFLNPKWSYLNHSLKFM
ncbi:phosphatidylinositol glycan anchor biosynthesis class U protein isoform X2 [Agrilus planipennis]|uniref:Phosphatidylinositol glycan anchor biosynthesis class U protein isoform X2 n=1 Tax=Agrilus planipennis TaxID=224129 RepID=A0A7F5R0V7_AGRPL|nr:phosphatidylinositol glycan anchor biosynthesis class U protein isoform X2 [Agrilus planipennis]